ncbi:hypothetical protein GDO86_020561 [Hymenochirus boettgeri]|uniref:DUF3715 domain-containing protein n=1 Tax=Hymenochirus boettgeri TaxID=247094 RepID=A0A8T2II64_9PIPI|nr:hypothetical protein GDO86_020561 [Hymenochirus boettgeri]
MAMEGDKTAGQNGEEPEENRVLVRSLSGDQGAARKRFQIPRKSRDKRALQHISCGSREFEEILKILHSSYLDTKSKDHFTYKSAQLVHNEFMEKEFTEKRRQLKFEGRQDKELAESYAFLLVDREQINIISEKGLHVGHSKITTLGKPSMGVYLSRYADLLQTNPLEPGATGEIFIFKVIKGKMKCVFDHVRSNRMDKFSGNVGLDPVPKHECHILKDMNAVTSLLSYRAFQFTQYYFYEYGFDEVLKRPRHVCPYAVVSFGYKDELTTRHPSLSGSTGFKAERNFDRNSFTLWRGQLLNKGNLLCYASLKSTSGPFIPYRLPEKLELNTFMHIDQIKKRIPTVHFCKETHVKYSEATHAGIYSRLYEVVEKTRMGSNLHGLLQKLEKENLALVKPLDERGFLLLFYPSPMTASYCTVKPRFLHALFIYRQSRITKPASNIPAPSAADTPEIMPDLSTFISSLHAALIKCQKDTSDDFNKVVEKHVHIYLKLRSKKSFKGKDIFPRAYTSQLDNKKSLYVAPKSKNHLESALRSYISGAEAYTLTVERANELMKEYVRFPQFSPISDYEPTEEDCDVKKTFNNKGSFVETNSEKVTNDTDYDLDKLNGLISLIQKKKQSKPEKDGSSGGGFKRKLEGDPENSWKYQKSEDNFNRVDRCESAHALISSLGGKDTDLREEGPEPSADFPSEYIKTILAKIANTCLDPAVVGTLKSMQNNTEGLAPPAQNLHPVPPAAVETTDNGREEEQVFYEDQQSLEGQDSAMLPLPPPTEEDLVTETSIDHAAQLGDNALDPPLDPPLESASPCPSSSAENAFPAHGPNTGSGMHWKLIPITGLELTEEQLVYVSTEDALPNDPRAQHKRRSSSYSPPNDTCKGRTRASSQERQHCKDRGVCQTSHKRQNLLHSKHCDSGLIENTVLEAYNTFSDQLHDVLKQKDIPYVGKMAAPVLSSDERVVKLSDGLCEQTSDIPIQQYVDDLRRKLDSVVASRVNPCAVERSITEETNVNSSFPGVDSSDETKVSRECSHSNGLYSRQIKEEPQMSTDPTQGREQESSSGREPYHSPQVIATSEANASNLADFSPLQLNVIKQMDLDPEIFNNLVKIITHVNKNSVKFYIHTEEENQICQNIKDYLLKLGNVECRPEDFLESNSSLDKLLIVIQNEDIANCIHRVPSLVELKRLSCVSFAGVESLDDLKNHTYNELFVSGGFIVSDETILNPETMGVDKLKTFFTFLEIINSPEGKWQWKIHFKFQKRLKEMGRVNANALSILTLLNTYQKKHLVEILSYHQSCDPQNQQTPQLECLIKLQVQNIQQRHVIFLTEKDASLFPDYGENGIMVTKMENFINHFKSLIGCQNDGNKENCLPHLPNQANDAGDNALEENNVKEEDDMSLDSEEETPEIEVSTDSVKCDTNTQQLDYMAQDKKEKSPDHFTLSNTPTLDEIQPITPVSAGGSATRETGVLPSDERTSGSDGYSREISLSHQFSQFNVLTHQTFLGSMDPLLANQGQIYFMNPYSQETSQNSEWNRK